MTVTPSSPAEVISSRVGADRCRCRFLAMSLICSSVTWNGLLSSQSLQLVDAVLDLVGELVGVLHHLPDHEPADQAHHDEAEDRGDRGGQPARQPQPA